MNRIFNFVRNAGMRRQVRMHIKDGWEELEQE